MASTGTTPAQLPWEPIEALGVFVELLSEVETTTPSSAEFYDRLCVATCRLAHGGWSAPAFFALTGGSWGAQIGAEGVDLVMMIMNEKGMRRLLDSKFQIGADASAAAGPVGRHAAAGTDWKLDTEILTYSRAKGAFAGLTLNGSKIDQDKDSTVAYYGKEMPLRATLLGKVPVPASARGFIAAVSRAKAMGENKS